MNNNTVVMPSPELFAQGTVAPVAEATPAVMPQFTAEQLQAMVASGQIQVVGAGSEQPVSDKGFMGLLGKLGQKQPQEEEVFTYEYNEITDLCLPRLSAEEKAKAIALVNQIERVKVSVHERQQRKVVIPDAELNNLNKMIKEFKHITKSTLFGQMELATRGSKVKFQEGLEIIETKTIGVVDGVQDTTCQVIDEVVELGKATLDFTGVAAKSIVTIGGTATKGILKTGFGLFRK